MMVSHFLRKYESLRETKVTEADPEVMSALITYSCPGNVRELEHVIERALVLGDGPVVRIQDLPEEIRLAGKAGRSAGPLKPGGG